MVFILGFIWYNFFVMAMEKFVYYGMLLDIYQSLLNDSSREIFKLYYEENLTLQEIADNLGVSKSYIGSSIKRSEKKLADLESKLHIYANKKQLEAILDSDNITEIKDNIKKIIEY